MSAAPFVSVVMPVYNAVRHLKAGAQSVLAQRFSDWELILVNDGSTDESGPLCDALALSDARVFAVHLDQNVGAGPARNAGLDRARGRYVLFMDADDVIEPDLLSRAHTALAARPAEVLVFGATEVHLGKGGAVLREVAVSCGPTRFYSGHDAVRRAVMPLERTTLYGYLWNKLYDVSYLRALGVRIESAPLNEDFFFNVQVFERLERLYVIDMTPYRYHRRPEGSLTGRWVPEYFHLHRRRIQALYDQHARWGLLTDGVRGDLAALYVRYIFSALGQNCHPAMGMDGRARRAFVHALYESPLFCALMPHARPKNPVVAALALPLKRRWTTMTLAAARLIYALRRGWPRLFGGLSRNR